MLQLIDGFRIGGAELNLLEQIENFDKKKYDITVCSFSDAGSLKSEFERLGLRVILITRKHRFDPTVFFKLLQLIRENKFKIVQTTLFYADVVGTLVAHFSKVPLVISLETASHNNVFYAKLHRRFLYWLAMRYVTCVIAVSQEVKDSIVKWAKVVPEKIKVIPNAVNLNIFKPTNNNLKQELGIFDSYPVLGVVARLSKVKGHTYLIQAVKKIVRDFPKTKCLFVGDGECRNELEEQVKQLELENNFLFLGFRKNVADLLHQMDIFILPSVSEGLPNVVVEAMACSKPVVGSNVGGIPEAIKNGINGTLVPPKDIDALASTILNLAKDKELQIQMGKNGRKLVEEKYSLEHQIQQFEDLYQYYFESIKN